MEVRSGKKARSGIRADFFRAILTVCLIGLFAMISGQARAYDFCQSQNPAGDIAWDLVDDGDAYIPFTFPSADAVSTIQAITSVSMRGKHQYSGDMAADLTAPDSTKVILFRLGDGRYGEGASFCRWADFDLSISDQGSGVDDLSVSTENTYCTGRNDRTPEPVWPQPYLPNFPVVGNDPALQGNPNTYNSEGMTTNRLSNFIGVDPLPGNWIFHVEDVYAADVGTVEELCINLDYAAVTYDMWVSADPACADQVDTGTFNFGETVYVCYVASNEATQDFELQSETNDHGQSLTELSGSYTKEFGGTQTVRTAIRSFTAGSAPIPIGTTALNGSITVEGTDVFFSSGETLTTDETVSITVLGPQTTMVKTVDIATASANDTLSYTITVDNNGTQDLTAPVLTDQVTQGGSPRTLTSGPTLVSGDTNLNNIMEPTETWVYSAQYQVTQDDFDDGGDILNTATFDTNETSPINDMATTTMDTQAPDLQVVKTGVITTDLDLDGKAGAGDVITYTYTITNTGNVTISNVFLTENHNGNGTPPLPTGETGIITTNGSTDAVQNNSWDTLRPGDRIQFTATYAVIQEDVDTLQ